MGLCPVSFMSPSRLGRSSRNTAGKHPEQAQQHPSAEIVMTVSFFHSFSSNPMAPGALLRERHSEREFLSWLRDIGGGFWVAAPSMGTHGSKTYACCKLEGFVLLFFFAAIFHPISLYVLQAEEQLEKKMCSKLHWKPRRTDSRISTAKQAAHPISAKFLPKTQRSPFHPTAAHSSTLP